MAEDEGVGEKRPLAIVDLDGVVADVRHRLSFVERTPKDWKRFFAAAVDDPVHEEGRAIVERLREEHEVIYLTGRPQTERANTKRWLEEHGLGGHSVYMRPPRERRPAAQVKVEVLRKLAAGRTVAIVVDDDVRVISAMEAAGFPTFHADWERRLLDEAQDEALRQAQEDDGRT